MVCGTECNPKGFDLKELHQDQELKTRNDDRLDADQPPSRKPDEALAKNEHDNCKGSQQRLDKITEKLYKVSCLSAISAAKNRENTACVCNFNIQSYFLSKHAANTTKVSYL